MGIPPELRQGLYDEPAELPDLALHSFGYSKINKSLWIMKEISRFSSEGLNHFEKVVVSGQVASYDDCTSHIEALYHQ